MQPSRPYRSRRTVLAVPASNERFIDKSRTLGVDAVFLDLEDAVAPAVKDAARGTVISALTTGQGWHAGTVTVRVNDWTTPWTTVDTTEVVTAAGQFVDALVLPKVADADQVRALDLVLTQAEQRAGLPVGRIGLELQIEDAVGLLHVARIAAASPRIETLVFGPGDYMASMGMGSLSVGTQPSGYTSDAFHHPLMSILVAARANGLQAIDGPFVGIRDLYGFTESAARSAALGYDGKWVLHPSQVDAGNDIYTPGKAEIERAGRIIAAYGRATSVAGGATGAIVVDEEMVDQAGVRLAGAILAKAAAAGLVGR